MSTLVSLAESILCRYIEDDDVRHIHEAGTIRELPQGEALFEEGDTGGSLFVVLTGKVHIIKRIAGADPRRLALLAPGDIIGELSLVDASPRSATAVTATAATLFEFSRRDMMGLIRSQPTAAAKVLWAVLETVSLRLRDTTEASMKWATVAKEMREKASL